MSCEPQKRCLVCGGQQLVPYLDLGKQPLANSYHQAGASLPTFPLGVQFCPNCSHNQLTHKVDNRLMFDDYPYVSGTSDTLTRYFRGFVQMVMSAWKGKKAPRVLEIASNDGTLLEMFKQRGCPVLGIDPAANLATLCVDRGLPTYVDYWGLETAKRIVDLEGKFDIVIAINVLPHVPNPQEFMDGCRLILDSTTKGNGIYIQTSQCDMFQNGEFDAIYHEHHSYFTASSFGTLAYGAGLEIREAFKVPIHSKSFLFHLGPMSGTGHSDSFYGLFEEENANGWHDVDSYKRWASEVDRKRTALRALLKQSKKEGRTLIGYGASAKANTVLNYCGVSLDYIIDDNPMKWGLLTPGRNIPIIGPDDPFEGTYVTWVMTSWNFKEEIVRKIHDKRKIFSWPEYVISYIPEVKQEWLMDLTKDLYNE